MARSCFHCGEGFDRGPIVTAHLNGRDVQVCCIGCRAAAEFIAQLGLEEFYRFRTAASITPEICDEKWQKFDEPQLLSELTRADARGRSVLLLIDNLTCAACSWLISRSLGQVAGVAEASVNTATGRARLVFNDQQVALSGLLQILADLGYRPHVLTPDAAELQAREERRAILKRLAVAGLGMMQVMMFAIALYVGERQGMEGDIREYLRMVSMLVATPVLWYSGWPFLVGAYAALKQRSITMDVPVALGLLLAFGASLVNAFGHTGDVYFDSVTMFVFFLTVARYVEMIARHRSNSVSDSLSRTMPAIAHRLASPAAGAGAEDVLISSLQVGDWLLVRSGETVPADGEIVEGSTRLDESMLTGESLPVERAEGDRVVAGTLNTGSPFTIQVLATGGATVLQHIVALLRRAQTERPRITRAADAMSSRFLTRVLIGAALVCLFWLLIEPARAFGATLAVLVVACPCAFSLATLVTVASANAALARRGILVTHQDAIEGLAKVSRVVFDKTGTLTTGKVSLLHCEPLSEIDALTCRALAARLESVSEHPIARAFEQPLLASGSVRDVTITPGAGIEGFIGGTAYRIGTAVFVGQSSKADEGSIFLASGQKLLARFTVGDALRPESASVLRQLHERGLKAEILSGDAATSVQRIAAALSVEEHSSRQSPAEKLARIKALSERGEFVAMVGDGINDAPVLGAAGVSVAMSRGSALALASADLILVGDSLAALPLAFSVARRAQAIIRQNLRWAAAYNLTAMPLAALGFVPPWVAAIGMSMSSIVVVLNALRLLRDERRTPLASERNPLLASPKLGSVYP